MRRQIAQSIGGKVTASFPGLPENPTVTIKTASGADLPGGAVVSAEAETTSLSVTIAEDTVAGAVDFACACLASNPPKVGATVCFVNATTLETATGLIRAVVKTGEVAESDPAEITIVLSLQDPLPIPLTEGDKGTGVEASFTLTAEQCPYIEQNRRAVFTATVQGESIQRETIFDVGLREQYNPATVNDIRAVWPDMWRSECIEWADLRGGPALDNAYNRVELRIATTGKNINRIRDTGPLVPLIVNRALREMAIFGLVPSAWVDNVADYIGQLDKDFAELFEEVMTGLRWYDDSDFGTTGVKVKAFNQIRLTR